MKKPELTSTQLKAIGYILDSSSIEEAAKKAKISRGTVYNWLKDHNFKKILERERNTLFFESLSLLKQANIKAARTLIDLLESRDESTRRLAAKEIINMSLKIAELKDLEERIGKIEEIIRQENNSKRGETRY